MSRIFRTSLAGGIAWAAFADMFMLPTNTDLGVGPAIILTFLFLCSLPE